MNDVEQILMGMVTILFGTTVMCLIKIFYLNNIIKELKTKIVYKDAVLNKKQSNNKGKVIPLRRK